MNKNPATSSMKCVISETLDNTPNRISKFINIAKLNLNSERGVYLWFLLGYPSPDIDHEDYQK